MRLNSDFNVISVQRTNMVVRILSVKHEDVTTRPASSRNIRDGEKDSDAHDFECTYARELRSDAAALPITTRNACSRSRGTAVVVSCCTSKPAENDFLLGRSR